MKFQFSIARLLMATAMVAFTFGLARMMLAEENSTFAIFVAALAVDLGLIVLVAQKRTDLYRVLRIVAFLICFLSLPASVALILGRNSPSRSWGCVLLVLGVAMIWFLIIVNRLMAKAEYEENEHNELPNGKV